MDFKFGLQIFATATESSAPDQMMGAGKLYFKRFIDGVYDTGKTHFMGNADDMTVTTTVTTVQKKSSMNKERVTMNSVNTGTEVVVNATLTEYDATNLALGLYGEEAIHTQVAGTLTKSMVVSPDTVIELRDANGDAYYNIAGITITPNSGGTPASIGVSTKETALASTGTVTSSGTYTGTTSKTYYAQVKVAPTAAGDLNGLEVEYGLSSIGPWTSAGVVSATATSHAFTLAEGVTFTFAVTTGQTFIINEIYQATATPAQSAQAYVLDTDYECDEQDARAGMIRILSTSATAADTPVTISFTVPAGAYPAISGGSAGEIEGYMRFVGDPNVGPSLSGEFWRVKLVPDGDTSGFIGTDFGTYKIKGTLLDDKKHHRAFPYYKTVDNR